MPSEFLVPRQVYLASGIHIGMKQKFKHMKPFIYKVRPDGLAVMNLQMIDTRIRTAAKFLSRMKNIVIVSRKNIAHAAVEKFAEIVGGHVIKGRFMPGTFTNPNYKNFYEADAVMIVDSTYDYQALKEATTARVPLIAICGTSNDTNGVDFIIPANNKSAKALATLFWILARETLKERGELKSNEDFKYKISDFMKEGAFGAEMDMSETPEELDEEETGRSAVRRTRSRTSRMRAYPKKPAEIEEEKSEQQAEKNEQPADQTAQEDQTAQTEKITEKTDQTEQA